MTYGVEILPVVLLAMLVIVYLGFRAISGDVLWRRRIAIMNAEFELQIDSSVSRNTLDRFFEKGEVPSESEGAAFDQYMRKWRKTVNIIWLSGQQINLYSKFLPRSSVEFENFVENRFHSYVSYASGAMSSRQASSYIFCGELMHDRALHQRLIGCVDAINELADD